MPFPTKRSRGPWENWLVPDLVEGVKLSKPGISHSESKDGLKTLSKVCQKGTGIGLRGTYLTNSRQLQYQK